MFNRNFKKNISCMFLSMILTTTMSTPLFAQEITINGLITETSSGQIEAELTSAIDGSPFIASFDPETDIVTMQTLNGEIIGQRNGYSVEKFEELVEINNTVTDEMKEPHTDRNRINDITKPSSKPKIRPYFETGRYVMDVPKEVEPDYSNALIGGKYIWTDEDNDVWVQVWTYEIPYSVNGIDVYITNEVGDDGYWDYDVDEYEEVMHMIEYPGERYAAKVSCFYRRLNNIELRFFSNTY